MIGWLFFTLDEDVLLTEEKLEVELYEAWFGWCLVVFEADIVGKYIELAE